MSDLYTKIVLTVIGLALSALALQAIVPTASAVAGLACGSSVRPCHVEIEVVLVHREMSEFEGMLNR